MIHSAYLNHYIPMKIYLFKVIYPSGSVRYGLTLTQVERVKKNCPKAQVFCDREVYFEIT